MSILISLWFAVAAVWALTGTNAQAALARQDLREDSDPLVQEAARLWVPIRWLSRPHKRRERAHLEARMREQPRTWARYRRLDRELSAWNALESSVALAFAGAAWSSIAAIIGR
jgi:hypothetical protein